MSEQEKNPMPWASIDHSGSWYASQCKNEIRGLDVAALLIQRWWRQRGLPQKYWRLYTLVQSQDFQVSRKSTANFQTAFLSTNFRAYEKLDGTNFGVRCDGAKFGRRWRVYEDMYQLIPLTGVVPEGKQVNAVKEAMLGHGCKATLILYGELMCNPNKFDYSERDMGGKFYCFGAMLQTDQCTDVLARTLREKGFVAHTASEEGQIRVVMNKALANLIEFHGILPVPMRVEGSLREVCTSAKDSLMKGGFEGVVLTSDSGSLFKWKTSSEDGSRSRQVLCSLLDENLEWKLELAGVDVSFARCLIDVATKTKIDGVPPPEKVNIKKKKKKKKKKTTKKKKKKKKKTTKNLPPTAYDEEILQQALTSAYSKYDSLEAYFDRGERDTILARLKDEVLNDLGATKENEIQCVENAIKKEIDGAFGNWMNSQE